MRSSFDPESDKTYTEQMRAQGRPVSPAMSFNPADLAGNFLGKKSEVKDGKPSAHVYKFPLFVLGHVILIRATGVILSVGAPIAECIFQQVWCIIVNCTCIIRHVWHWSCGAGWR